MDYQLENLMENIVLEKYNSMKDEFARCQCEQCKYDILAFVLNRLPPKYFVTDKGALYAKLDFLTIEFDAAIVTELIKAFEMIGSNPRHEKSS